MLFRESPHGADDGLTRNADRSIIPRAVHANENILLHHAVHGTARTPEERDRFLDGDDRRQEFARPRFRRIRRANQLLASKRGECKLYHGLGYTRVHRQGRANDGFNLGSHFTTLRKFSC